MSTTTSGLPAAAAASAAPPWWRRYVGLVAAFAVLAAICLLPPAQGLPVAGQRALGILAFAVVLWVSEAVDYTVSAVMIMAALIILLGLAPNPANPAKQMGFAMARDWALTGFSNNAVALVGAALVFAAAVFATGLDKRLALWVLSRVGSNTMAIFGGTVLVGIVLAFMVPSATARVSAVVPIVLGIIGAFGIQKQSRFAAILLIGSAQVCSVMNITVLTAAAQNVTFLGFLGRMMPGATVTWSQWLMAALPFCVLMVPLVFAILWKFHRPEVDSIEGGKAMVQASLDKLGPMTGAEWRVFIACAVLLGVWSTEGMLHSIDTASSTMIAIAVLLLPGIGVMNWKQAAASVPGGTLVLFAVGVSLGTVMVQSQGAAWLARLIVDIFNLRHAAPFTIVAVMAAFLILVHLGFASATALASAFIPIVIGVLQEVSKAGVPVNIVGVTMILQFTISFGFMLVVNAPQNMVAFGTGAFNGREFTRSGVVITIAGYLVILLLSATVWNWMGLISG